MLSLKPKILPNFHYFIPFNCRSSLKQTNTFFTLESPSLWTELFFERCNASVSEWLRLNCCWSSFFCRICWEYWGREERRVQRGRAQKDHGPYGELLTTHTLTLIHTTCMCIFLSKDFEIHRFANSPGTFSLSRLQKLEKHVSLIDIFVITACTGFARTRNFPNSNLLPCVQTQNLHGIMWVPWFVCLLFCAAVLSATR